MKFNLKAYASPVPFKNAFLLRGNSATTQKLRTNSAKKFGACRLVPRSDDLEVILSGDLQLVVLQRISEDHYDFIFPLNPYVDLLFGTVATRSVTVKVQPSDIVLLMPRSIFTSKDYFISPHDIPGAFHYTDLHGFASSFVNFINYVHSRTNHFGVIAVGGFIY